MNRTMTRSLTAAAALIAATSFAAGTTAPASATARPHVHGTNTVEGYGVGFGDTPAAAEAAAVQELRGNYRGCQPYSLAWDKPSGSGWLAEVTATCQFYT